MTGADCTKCKWATRDQVVDAQNKPVVGEYQYMCKRMPPSVFALYNPDGSFKLASAFPVVALGMYCSMYEGPTILEVQAN